MGAMVRILGIDPGLRNTGWGIIESDGMRLIHKESGTITSPSQASLPERLMVLHDGLAEVIRHWAPDEAAVEQTFVNKNGATTLKLGQARGVALLVPALAGVPVAEYAPNAVKKTVVGAGQCEKSQIRAMIGYLLPRACPKSDDAADALAVAITHAHHRQAKRLADKLAVRSSAQPALA